MATWCVWPTLRLSTQVKMMSSVEKRATKLKVSTASDSEAAEKAREIVPLEFLIVYVLMWYMFSYV